MCLLTTGLVIPSSFCRTFPQRPACHAPSIDTSRSRIHGRTGVAILNMHEDGGVEVVTREAGSSRVKSAAGRP